MSAGQVSVRKIHGGDAPLLVRWRNENAKYFPAREPLTELEHGRWFRDVYERDPSQAMFIAELDGKPVGCLAMTIRDGKGELERMILGDKSISRGGVMRAAFRQVMDAYGLERYWLRIYPWNHVTISFHERNGFAITGRTPDGEYLVMEKHGRGWPDD